MKINKTTYRANDIRGIADSQLTNDFCTLAGLAYVELLRKYRRKEPQELRVVVGKDVRNSSPRLKTAFAEALVSKGVHVIDIAPGAKVSSTPLMYFATWLISIQTVALKSRAATWTRNGTGSTGVGLGY